MDAKKNRMSVGDFLTKYTMIIALVVVFILFYFITDGANASPCGLLFDLLFDYLHLNYTQHIRYSPIQNKTCRHPCKHYRK